MANSSFYDVFERMWQHVLTIFNNYAPTEVLDNHIENQDNPHHVTAEQVGALPITGGVMENTLTVNGIVLTEGIDYGSGDPGGGVLGQLYFKKVT
jgi:hypothetical protein